MMKLRSSAVSSVAKVAKADSAVAWAALVAVCPRVAVVPRAVVPVNSQSHQ